MEHLYKKEEVTIADLFRAEIAKQKVILGIKNQDLARMTKIPHSTIRKYMCGDTDADRVADAIARALHIKRE